MPKVVQVRDVPDDVHQKVTLLAEHAGMSLNRFLVAELGQLARRVDNNRIIERAKELPGRRLSTEEIVATLREMRDVG